MRIGTPVCAALLFASSTAGLHASPAEQAAIAAGCQASTNWSAAACQCLANEAGNLSDDQQKFLAATLNEQKNEATQYAANLSQAEMMQAAMFVTRAGPGCQ